MNIQNVGVVGAGIMGTGVAQALAQTGFQVTLIDLSEKILMGARETIHNNIRLQALFGQKNDEPPGTILDRITPSSDYRSLENSDFIIENVPERWPIKSGVYPQLDAVCPAHCIFAANTSAISITRIAALTQRADRVIGIHFMNPVPMKKTVEMVRGYHSSEATLQSAQALLARMGKQAITVNDSAGFVANRLSHLFMNEAANLVLENVATARQIDEIFKQCYGHAMGPLETADLIGLDTVVDTLQVLHDSFQDPRFRCSPLLRKLVDAGCHGRKSGQGFHSYRQA